MICPLEMHKKCTDHIQSSSFTGEGESSTIRCMNVNMSHTYIHIKRSRIMPSKFTRPNEIIVVAIATGFID